MTGRKPNLMPERHGQHGNDSALAELLAWFRLDCLARERSRSFGEQVIRLVWEDGQIRMVEVLPKQQMKPGMPGALYITPEARA